MTWLHSIRAFLRGGTPGFLPLEHDILMAVAARLDTDRRGILLSSIDRVNLVQRSDGGREVRSYRMMHGKPQFDPALRLTGRQGEAVLARFSFRDADGQRDHGRIWLVDGLFFSIEFEAPTEHALDVPPVQLRVTLQPL